MEEFWIIEGLSSFKEGNCFGSIDIASEYNELNVDQ